MDCYVCTDRFAGVIANPDSADDVFVFEARLTPRRQLARWQAQIALRARSVMGISAPSLDRRFGAGGAGAQFGRCIPDGQRIFTRAKRGFNLGKCDSAAIGVAD